jgi:hypothetical protein
VKIKFSRHAKRRAKLYKITESTVADIVKDANLPDGEHEIIKEVEGFEFPIKISASVEGENITIITNYPLKKGKNK